MFMRNYGLSLHLKANWTEHENLCDTVCETWPWTKIVVTIHCNNQIVLKIVRVQKALEILDHLQCVFDPLEKTKS